MPRSRKNSKPSRIGPAVPAQETGLQRQLGLWEACSSRGRAGVCLWVRRLYRV